MRVHVVDPSAYTPPYDHALCAALALEGAEVDLFTSRFAHGAVAPPLGYRRHEFFYRAAVRLRDARARRAVKLAEHVPDMLRYRRAARAADVVHFQWLTVQHLDGHLLPSRRAAGGARRPLVLSAHDILPREPRSGQLRAQRSLYGRFDAIVVHSEHGRRRLIQELGVEAERVRVIPHGAFEHLAEAPAAGADPAAGGDHADADLAREPPVVLCFGLMRPYKGIDLLLAAWEGIADAELWVVGAPRMDIAGLRRSLPAGARLEPRFVAEEELATYFRRAALVVLPYREIDQSGVLFTALAFGKPLLLSDVGGFPEIAATGAARTFPAGDVGALHDSLRDLLADPVALAAMGRAARAAAAGPYSWRTAARSTIALYRELLDGATPR